MKSWEDNPWVTVWEAKGRDKGKPKAGTKRSPLGTAKRHRRPSQGRNKEERKLQVRYEGPGGLGLELWIELHPHEAREMAWLAKHLP